MTCTETSPPARRSSRRCGASRVDGVQFWLIRTANPDGRKARSRHNARGVDLNRNFPYRWAKGAKGTYYPGPSAGSEPETKALMRFVRRIRPQLGIYYHQHMGITVRARSVDTDGPARLRPPHRAATALAAELPRHRDRLAEPPDPGGTAFVVELKAGPAPVKTHVDAVIAAARSYVR